MKKYFNKMKKMAGINDNPEEQELKDDVSQEQGAEQQAESVVNEAEEKLEEEVIEGDAESDDPLEKLRVEKAEMHNKYVRLFAEFDNYKKRTSREKVDLITTAGSKTIKKFLPIVDDFKRAIKTNEQENESDHNEGFVMIYNKFLKTLEDMGVKQMECMGEKFDADFHEAMAEIDAPSEDKKGHILDIIEDGYMMGDKIIRYARVVVGK